MDEKKSPQNRYCCVPLCNQKGSTGPNGEKVGFFNLPTDQAARDQWLHAIRRDTGKHFTITDATKVCSLHFKKENLKKSLGIGRLSYGGQFHPFSHGKGAHLERESRRQLELPLRIQKRFVLSKLEHRLT